MLFHVIIMRQSLNEALAEGTTQQPERTKERKETSPPMGSRHFNSHIIANLERQRRKLLGERNKSGAK